MIKKKAKGRRASFRRKEFEFSIFFRKREGVFASHREEKHFACKFHWHSG